MILHWPVIVYRALDIREHQALADELVALEQHVLVVVVLDDIQHRLVDHQHLSRSWNDRDWHVTLLARRLRGRICARTRGRAPCQLSLRQSSRK